MQIVILLCIPLWVWASGEQLNHGDFKAKRWRDQKKIKRHMHMHHKIDHETAKQIVLDETGEEEKSFHLKYRDNYLFYRIKTKNYYLEVNALDGTVIKKEQIRE